MNIKKGSLIKRKGSEDELLTFCCFLRSYNPFLMEQEALAPLLIIYYGSKKLCTKRKKENKTYIIEAIH
jgi:hypothetical protein